MYAEFNDILKDILEAEEFSIDFDSLFKPYSIEEIIDIRLKLGECTKNPDGSYSCKDDVDLSGMGLEKLPVRFKEVIGNFDCSNNKFTTLEGSPEYVSEFFWCSHNKLTTLKGAPRKVRGGFICSDNELVSLEGAPRYVGFEFLCLRNRLRSLEGAPEYVGGWFDCSDNKLTSLKGIGRVRWGIICRNNPVPEDELLKTIGGR